MNKRKVVSRFSHLFSIPSEQSDSVTNQIDKMLPAQPQISVTVPDTSDSPENTEKTMERTLPKELHSHCYPTPEQDIRWIQIPHQERFIHVSLTKRRSWVDAMLIEGSKNTSNDELSLALTQQQILKKFVSSALWVLVGPSVVKNLPKALHSMAKSLVFDFVDTIINGLPVDPQCFVIGLLYLYKVINSCKDLELDLLSYKRYYAVCLMLSEKMWEDSYRSNEEYFEFFQLFDVSRSKFNSTEREVLVIVDYELFVTLERYKSFIVEHAKMHSKEIQEQIEDADFIKKSVFYKNRLE